MGFRESTVHIHSLVDPGRGINIVQYFLCNMKSNGFIGLPSVDYLSRSYLLATGEKWREVFACFSFMNSSISMVIVGLLALNIFLAWDDNGLCCRKTRKLSKAE